MTGVSAMQVREAADNDNLCTCRSHSGCRRLFLSQLMLLSGYQQVILTSVGCACLCERVGTVCRRKSAAFFLCLHVNY